MVVIDGEFVTIVLTVLGAGVAVGRYFPKKSQINSQQQQVDWAVAQLRGRIRWINEMRTNLRGKITTNTPKEVEAAYQDLIHELETYIVLLQGSLDGILEKQ
jgi:hypothetical protein